MDDVEQLRSRTWATVLIEPRFAPILRDQFGRHAHAEGRPKGGRVKIRVAAPTPLDLARNLAGWGSLIDVLEPPAVRAELGRIGAELASVYGS